MARPELARLATYTALNPKLPKAPYGSVYPDTDDLTLAHFIERAQYVLG
jgi:hypothetical protein